MKILTFSAESPAKALQKAQLECGENALVVSTKQIQKQTLNKKALFEVVIALEEEPNKLLNKKQVQTKSYTVSDDVVMNISEAAKQISKIASVSSQNSREEINKFSHKNYQNDIKKDDQTFNELGEIKKEINKLTDKVKTIQEMFWSEKAPNNGKIIIPPEFSEIYKLAYKSGMDKDHLSKIMSLTLEHMPNKMKNSTDTVKRYFQVLLRKMILIREESAIFKEKQKIIMLVGPTGVGKTTTLAKLAARYAYICEKRHRVGIITLDTYRIGAVEQLFQYAKMMRLPIEDVVDVDDFQEALKSLSNCDIVLIDTVGSSQYDKEKIINLDNFLKNSPIPIDVNLVMSANTKLEDLTEIYDGFSFLEIDTLIFTKFDETKMFGNIFSLVYDINKPISYFSIGQEVPDDLKLASSEYLIDCMLNGFSRVKYDN